MPQTLKMIVFAAMLAVGVETVPAHAAEREQVRMVINLIAGVNQSDRRREDVVSTELAQQLPSSR